MKQQIKTNKVMLSNGEEIHYREAGTGPVLVLLHGNMTSSFHLEDFIRSVSHQVRVIAPDLRGFGLSSYKRPLTSLKNLSDDIADLLEQLKIDQYAIAGWSTGGGVALQHSIEHSEKVSKLILISSVGISGYPIQSNGGLGGVIKSKQVLLADPVLTPIFSAFENKDKGVVRGLWDMVVYNHGQPAPEAYEELIDDVLTQVNLADIYFALSTFNLSDESNGVVDGNGLINQLKTPTLILHGEDDLVIPVATAYQSEQRLIQCGIPVSLISYPDSGHSLFNDQLDAISHQVVTFIQ